MYLNLGILVHCWVTMYNNDIVYSKISKKAFEYFHDEEMMFVEIDMFPLI